MSFDSPELQGRFSFLPRLAKLSDSAIEKSLADATLSPEAITRIRNGGWVALRGSETVAQPRVPAVILGSDSIEIETIAPIGLNKSKQNRDFYVELNLFKDGAPYIPERDDNPRLEKLDIIPTNEYVVFAGSELLPTIVNFEYLNQADNETKPGNIFSFKSFNHVTSLFGETAIQQLTDTECDAILNAISQSSGAVSVKDFVSMWGS